MVHLVAFALEEERIEHQDTPTGLGECVGFEALKTGRRNGTRGTRYDTHTTERDSEGAPYGIPASDIPNSNAVCCLYEIPNLFC